MSALYFFQSQTWPPRAPHAPSGLYNHECAFSLHALRLPPLSTSPTPGSSDSRPEWFRFLDLIFSGTYDCHGEHNVRSMGTRLWWEWATWFMYASWQSWMPEVCHIDAQPENTGDGFLPVDRTVENTRCVTLSVCLISWHLSSSRCDFICRAQEKLHILALADRFSTNDDEMSRTASELEPKQVNSGLDVALLPWQHYHQNTTPATAPCKINI